MHPCPPEGLGARANAPIRCVMLLHGQGSMTAALVFDSTRARTKTVMARPIRLNRPGQLHNKKATKQQKQNKNTSQTIATRKRAHADTHTHTHTHTQARTRSRMERLPPARRGGEFWAHLLHVGWRAARPWRPSVGPSQQTSSLRDQARGPCAIKSAMSKTFVSARSRLSQEREVRGRTHWSLGAEAKPEPRDALTSQTAGQGQSSAAIGSNLPLVVIS